ncbi:MAG: glycosyltransferase [Saprospiraceae bacterium]|nr:glycosyltransferase [Saprospiraceae bacterium]
MKIAIVSPYPPSKLTLNEYAHHLVTHFQEKREITELIVITNELPEGEQYSIDVGNVPVRFEAVWNFNSFKNPLSILKTIKLHKPDVVFYNIHFLTFGDNKVAAALGLMTPMLTRLSGFVSVVLLHNIIESVDLSSAGFTRNVFLKWIYTMFGTFLTFMLLRANLVAVTISKYVSILEKKYKADNIALVPHGSFETPDEPSFQLPAGPKKIMTFGKFGTYKKVESMIEAVELVRNRTGADLEIVIAGTDSPNVQGYLDAVQEKYSEVPQITFTGYVEEEDVPRIFKESAMVVFPYTSTTGSSGVLHQAGSYGCAAILPNIGDLKALIEEEGYRGNYFEPDNVESLADAIEELVLNDEKRIQLGKANYVAAASLPMADITDWYMLHFNHLINEKAVNKQNSTVAQLIKSLNRRETVTINPAQ